MNDYLVQMKGIVKSFPGVLALDHVDFELRPGEVHMLLGENGAGKSTLIKVLSGAYPCDEGEILIKGKKVDIQSAPRRAQSRPSLHLPGVEPRPADGRRAQHVPRDGARP